MSRLAGWGYPLPPGSVPGSSRGGGAATGTTAPVMDANGQPVIKQQSPATLGRLKAAGEVEGGDINADRTMINGEMAHVIDNALPAQQQLLQLRDLAAKADSGENGQFRLQLRNFLSTYAPKSFGPDAFDAAPAQEFQKVALQNSGAQERADLGARGGARAIEMYSNPNPNLGLQPTANRDMANALLIGHQRSIDYAQGATDFYTRQRAGFVDPISPQPYTPVSSYDNAFSQQFKPEVYYSAIQAINGKPEAEWSKGLTPLQIQMTAGIVARADPNAVIDVGGRQIPVSAIKKTFDPTDVSVPPPGGTRRGF